MTIRGRRNGAEARFQAHADFRTEQTGNDYVPQLWAARKAGTLSREIRLHGQTPELMAALKQLALRYGILTEYTSYLVQEPNAVANFSGGRDNDLRRAAPAAAPRDQAGAGAVAQAREEAALRGSVSLGSIAVTDAEAKADMDLERGRAGMTPTRRIGGRLFILRDSTWTDLQHRDSLPVVSIVAYSDAYFAVLRAIPELSQPAALNPKVLVAGRRMSIKIEAGGKTAWRPGELERLVREFRS